MVAEDSFLLLILEFLSSSQIHLAKIRSNLVEKDYLHSWVHFFSKPCDIISIGFLFGEEIEFHHFFLLSRYRRWMYHQQIHLISCELFFLWRMLHGSKCVFDHGSFYFISFWSRSIKDHPSLLHMLQRKLPKYFIKYRETFIPTFEKTPPPRKTSRPNIKMDINWLTLTVLLVYGLTERHGCSSSSSSSVSQ